MQHTSGFDARSAPTRVLLRPSRRSTSARYRSSPRSTASASEGRGLVGNADCVVASEDAYFGVPEVKQGALGAATHLARLVPQHMMRTLYFTARTIKAADLVQFGSVPRWSPRPA